jgi:hypothetical protein
MATVSQDSNPIYWQMNGLSLTDREINLLFEIFGPLPISNQFTVRGDALIGLGKSRVLIQNQDELRDALYGYLEVLTSQQQFRVHELVNQWDKISTKVIKFSKAERVDFRVSYPEEKRALLRTRLQTFIPIYTKQEIENYTNTGETGSSSNHIDRG